MRVKNKIRLRGSRRANGYYADRDFAHTGAPIAKSLLQEQLTAPLPVTDVPMFVSAGWFRMTGDRYYVPVSLAVPGGACRASKPTR